MGSNRRREPTLETKARSGVATKGRKDAPKDAGKERNERLSPENKPAANGVNEAGGRKRLDREDCRLPVTLLSGELLGYAFPEHQLFFRSCVGTKEIEFGRRGLMSYSTRMETSLMLVDDSNNQWASAQKFDVSLLGEQQEFCVQKVLGPT